MGDIDLLENQPDPGIAAATLEKDNPERQIVPNSRACYNHSKSKANND